MKGFSMSHSKTTFLPHYRKPNNNNKGTNAAHHVVHPRSWSSVINQFKGSFPATRRVVCQ